MTANYSLYQGDCLDVMNTLESNSIDSIITDPPAGISFMGKEWDKDKGGRDIWIKWMTTIAQECYRVLKPGGHALVWSLPRTSHWTGTAWENANFEIRDCIYHIFSSGFPKSLNIGKEMDRLQDITDLAKQWNGWGTALTPSTEQWWLLRKPISEKNIALNVLKWGTGAININATRISGDTWHRSAGGETTPYSSETTWNTSNTPRIERSAEGRWPKNAILAEETEEEWAKYFYCSKAQKRDRDEGLESLPDKEKFSALNTHNGTDERFDGAPTPIAKNTHPTVKPTDLMRYLCNLITPPEGVILDPFMGSGSTGKAAILDGFNFIGIDIEQEYLELARLRIEYALSHIGTNV